MRFVCLSFSLLIYAGCTYPVSELPPYNQYVDRGLLTQRPTIIYEVFRDKYGNPVEKVNSRYDLGTNYFHVSRITSNWLTNDLGGKEYVQRLNPVAVYLLVDPNTYSYRPVTNELVEERREWLIPAGSTIVLEKVQAEIGDGCSSIMAYGELNSSLGMSFHFEYKWGESGFIELAPWEASSITNRRYVGWKGNEYGGSGITRGSGVRP